MAQISAHGQVKRDIFSMHPKSGHRFSDKCKEQKKNSTKNTNLLSVLSINGFKPGDQISAYWRSVVGLAIKMER